ncbi:MAG: lamin tail domain-containing protein [candidate division WOR-3 bacterium]
MIKLFLISLPVISEVMSNVKGSDSQSPGTPGDRNEFIEIFNSSDEVIDLLNYKITDFDATDIIIPWTNDSILLYYPDVKINTTKIEPKSFAVILDPEYLQEGDGNYVRPYNFPPGTVILTVGNTTIGDGLSTNDPIALISPSGDTVSTYGTPYNPDDSIPLSPPDGVSVERINLFGPDEFYNWAFSEDTSGSTPGRENSIKFLPDLLINSKSIIITPPFPEENKEFEIFVKFYNNGFDTLRDIKIYIEIKDFYKDSLKFPGFLLKKDSAIVEFKINPLQKGIYKGTIYGKSVYDSDTLNNKINFNLFVSLKPLFITEIMYDSDYEWVEIYNASNDTLNISNFGISDENKKIENWGNLKIEPEEYIVIIKSFEDTNYLFPKFGRFKCIAPYNKFYSLNDLKDIVYIYDFKGNIIDSVPYENKWGGGKDISLERKGIDFPSQERFSWGSSISPQGATPGRENSITEKLFPEGKYVYLDGKIFKEENDLKLFINPPYNLTEVKILLFDSKGRLKEKIFDNFTISSKRVYNLSQIMKERKAGLYIIYVELKEKEGNKKLIKKIPFAIWK